jgi:hypothetical protein
MIFNFNLESLFEFLKFLLFRPIIHFLHLMSNESLLLFIIDRSLKEDDLIEFSDKYKLVVTQILKEIMLTLASISPKISKTKICIIESNDVSLEVNTNQNNQRSSILLKVLRFLNSSSHSIVSPPKITPSQNIINVS